MNITFRCAAHGQPSGLGLVNSSEDFYEFVWRTPLACTHGEQHSKKWQLGLVLGTAGGGLAAIGLLVAAAVVGCRWACKKRSSAGGLGEDLLGDAAASDPAGSEAAQAE